MYHPRMIMQLLTVASALRAVSCPEAVVGNEASDRAALQEEQLRRPLLDHDVPPIRRLQTLYDDQRGLRNPNTAEPQEQVLTTQ
jgi:hypothetical protein